MGRRLRTTGQTANDGNERGSDDRGTRRPAAARRLESRCYGCHAGLPRGQRCPPRHRAAAPAAARPEGRTDQGADRQHQVGRLLGRAAQYRAARKHADGCDSSPEGASRSAGPPAKTGGDQARDRHLRGARLRGEDERGAPGGQLRRSAAWSVQWPPAVLDLPRHQPHRAGGDREDRRRLGSVQVRRGAQGTANRRVVASCVARRVEHLAGLQVRWYAEH